VSKTTEADWSEDTFDQVCDTAEKQAAAVWNRDVPVGLDAMNGLLKKAMELGVMHGARAMASEIACRGMLQEPCTHGGGCLCGHTAVVFCHCRAQR
jgi:hypothetical protein